MANFFLDPQTYIGLATLTALEIVLGIDNLIFVSLVANRLPRKNRELARRIGLSLALFGRLALLFSLTWILGLTTPLFTISGFDVSGHNIVLLAGGLFLLYKSTQEIFTHLEGDDLANDHSPAPSMFSAILQIIALDIVFSLDSIITAIGLTSHIAIMALAVTISVAIMLFFSTFVGEFLDRHPSMKLLGIAFLLMISVLLIAEAFGTHVPREYVYFALAFSVGVEVINIQHRKKNQKN